MYRFLILFTLLSISCNKAIDLKIEEEAIKTQVDQVRQAHFNKNAVQFFQPNAEEWYDIRSGQIKLIKKADRIPSTQAYLDQMDFKEMIMRDEPIIEISDDATLATYSNSSTIKGVLGGNPVLWVTAWQSVLKKIDGEWKIISTTNTEATKPISAATLLNHVRKRLGKTDSIASIYAYADCVGPDRPFKTVVLSSKTDGRMEQSHNAGHFVMKHGESSWYNDLKSNSSVDSLEASTKAFIKGHELHWISMWPEDRYSKPSFEGITTYADQDAFRILFYDDDNRPVNFYYAFENYRPLGFDISPSGFDFKVNIYFNEWETIDNRLVFKKATFDQEGDIFEYNFKDIKFNTLSDSDFENEDSMITTNK